jgi:ADP-ribosylation factor GTPase-activating protein 2/3
MPSCKSPVAYTLRQILTSSRYPEEVVIVDLADDAGASGTTTPAGDDDDFFSSWDKPTIKRPSNPPSRSGTPGINRTNSPFLNPPANGAARPKSPLTADAQAPAPTTARAIPASAARKTAVGGAAPRKANILGAKKKLGAKKVDPAALDFDAAERKAREEAERIAKLGYDPEAEATPAEAKITSAQSDSTIVSPQPVSPRPAAGFGATGKSKEKQGEVEGLNVAVRKLGFGQVGGGAPAAAAPKKMGFGSTTRATEGEERRDQVHSTKLTNIITDDSEKYARQKFGVQKGISSDEFFGRGTFDSNSQQEAKSRLQGFEGAQSISSNAYFGRPEDEMPEGEYGDIETAAKDFVRKLGITAGDDLENLTSLLGEGTNKLQGKSYEIVWVD